jgi:hypothetical protein
VGSAFISVSTGEGESFTDAGVPFVIESTLISTSNAEGEGFVSLSVLEDRREAAGYLCSRAKIYEKWDIMIIT